jgi:hypothetical protein
MFKGETVPRYDQHLLAAMYTCVVAVDSYRYAKLGRSGGDDGMVLVSVVVRSGCRFPETQKRFLVPEQVVE